MRLSPRRLGSRRGAALCCISATCLIIAVVLCPVYGSKHHALALPFQPFHLRERIRPYLCRSSRIHQPTGPRTNTELYTAARMVDVARPLSTLSYMVESTRTVRKADFAEIMHTGHEAVLERKRMASVPLPSRHASSVSLNRVQLEDSISMNMELTNADDEDDDEDDDGSDAASMSTVSPAMTPLHKSFTADTRTYETLQRGGRRASGLLGLQDVNSSASSAFVSALRAKSRLLIDLEDSSIMKQRPVRTPSLQMEQPILAWSQSSMLASTVTTSAADSMLQQLQAATSESPSAKPRPTRRSSVAMIPEASLFAPARSANSVTTGSVSGRSTPLITTPRGTSTSASKLPLIAVPNSPIGTAAASVFSGSDEPCSPAHSVPLVPVPPAQPRVGSSAALRRASMTSILSLESPNSVMAFGSAERLPKFSASALASASQLQLRDGRPGGQLASPANLRCSMDVLSPPSPRGTAPANAVGSKIAAAWAAAPTAPGGEAAAVGMEASKKVAAYQRGPRPASRMSDAQSILRSPNTLPSAAGPSSSTLQRSAFSGLPSSGASGSGVPSSGRGSTSGVGGDAEGGSKDRPSGLMGRLKLWVKKRAD